MSRFKPCGGDNDNDWSDGDSFNDDNVNISSFQKYVEAIYASVHISHPKKVKKNKNEVFVWIHNNNE